VPVERVIEVHKRFFDLPVTGVYNIGTGKAVSFMDVARTVALETDAEIVTVPMPYIPRLPAVYAGRHGQDTLAALGEPACH
jgi:hypothetical protein